MGEAQEDKTREAPASAASNGNGNGNGHHKSQADAIGEPEFFLIPLLASDPIPYLVDGDGKIVDAEGNEVAADALPPALQKLRTEGLPTEAAAEAVDSAESPDPPTQSS